jgi:hypothetical protein
MSQALPAIAPQELAIAPRETGFSHLVQLFDSEESLGDGVTQFLREGLARNDQMLVVVTESGGTRS